MADINDLKTEIDKHLYEKQQHFESIYYCKNPIKDRLKKKTLLTESTDGPRQLKTKSKEEIYNDLKDKFRFAWKSPGYCNDEFNKIPVLKAKVLSVWERERALMPERSCKAPEGFKGMKVTYHSRDFGEASETLLPKLYKTHLEDVKKDYKDRVMRPSKYGPLKEDILMANLFNREKERGWKRSNTKQINAFGHDKNATFKSEQTLKGTKLLTSTFH